MQFKTIDNVPKPSVKDIHVLCGDVHTFNTPCIFRGMLPTCDQVLAYSECLLADQHVNYKKMTMHVDAQPFIEDKIARAWIHRARKYIKAA